MSSLPLRIKIYFQHLSTVVLTSAVWRIQNRVFRLQLYNSNTVTYNANIRAVAECRQAEPTAWSKSSEDLGKDRRDETNTQGENRPQWNCQLCTNPAFRLLLCNWPSVTVHVQFPSCSNCIRTEWSFNTDFHAGQAQWIRFMLRLQKLK
jgi:hypothetical protein